MVSGLSRCPLGYSGAESLCPSGAASWLTAAVVGSPIRSTVHTISWLTRKLAANERISQPGANWRNLANCSMSSLRHHFPKWTARQKADRSTVRRIREPEVVVGMAQRRMLLIGLRMRGFALRSSSNLRNDHPGLPRFEDRKSEVPL